MTPLMTAAAFLAGGLALAGTGWRMELASVRATQEADPPADDEQEADDAVPAEDL